jgi:glutamate---cysteine ligase / carboxylate-amine ligase
MVYTVGIEEEFFLFDRRDCTPIARMNEAFFAEAREACGESLQREMLQCQIEIATKPHGRVRDARDELRVLRRTIAVTGQNYDIGIAACGTNPLAIWREQRLTRRARYGRINDDLGMIGLRNLVCGMHVHVAPPPEVDRVALMNRALPYLPVLFALSTSSPFWEGRSTGLISYRLAAYRELPRTGLPPSVSTQAQYDEYIAALVGAGVIPDASHVWWALRPSLRYPTLELRITDACTSVEDTAAVAALYQCLLAWLVETGDGEMHNGPTDRAIAEENLWRVQRHGLEAPYIDSATGEAGPMRDRIVTLADTLYPFARRFDCTKELAHVGAILKRGTSADRQLDIFRVESAKGADAAGALQEVVRWLMTETADAGRKRPAPQEGALCAAISESARRKSRSR